MPSANRLRHFKSEKETQWVSFSLLKSMVQQQYVVVTLHLLYYFTFSYIFGQRAAMTPAFAYHSSSFAVALLQFIGANYFVVRWHIFFVRITPACIVFFARSESCNQHYTQNNSVSLIHIKVQ
jgi:hypothetical protein